MKFLPDPVQILIKHCLTGIDGETYDIARVIGIAGVIFYMVMTVYNVAHEHVKFDYVNWGIGFASVISSMGVAIKLKENQEPKA